MRRTYFILTLICVIQTNVAPASDLKQRINAIGAVLEADLPQSPRACSVLSDPPPDCAKIFEHICDDRKIAENLKAVFEHLGDEDRRAAFNAITEKYTARHGEDFQRLKKVNTDYLKEISDTFFPPAVRTTVDESILKVKGIGFKNLPFQIQGYAKSIESIWPDSQTVLDRDLYEWSNGAGASYIRHINKLLVYGSLPKNNDHLTYWIAHELGHGIVENASLIKIRNRDGSFPGMAIAKLPDYYGETVDGKKIEALRSCISEKIASELKSELDIAAIEKILQSKNSRQMAQQLRMNREQIQSIDKLDLSIPNALREQVLTLSDSLTEQRTDELLADWFAAESFANLLESDGTRSADEKKEAIFSVVRGYCNQGSHSLKTTGDHPSGQIRIEKILLANPRLRKVTGCQFRSQTAPRYCSLD